MHQAIEAKELVKLSPETRAMASVTYQSLFRKFKKISGMTGTGKTAEKEFLDTYGMQVVQIPTNRSETKDRLSRQSLCNFTRKDLCFPRVM